MTSNFTSCADISWSHWKATDDCSLVFICNHSRILLIRKKRGLGAGKVNGPGGRRERGESIEACGIREVREEVGLSVSNLELAGELRFQFLDGYSTYVHVFRTSCYQGLPIETEEAEPFWVEADAIPYDEMWADDRFWLPMMLDGRRFDGRFLFDRDHLMDYVLHEVSDD